MTPAIVTLALIMTGILLFGTPFAAEQPERGHHWDSPVAILPMTFAHRDHLGQNCLDCHHNYVDDTGNGDCMVCHVTDDAVAGLLEEQFHTLCMGCHVAEGLTGNAHGPVRRCVACHLGEDDP